MSNTINLTPINKITEATIANMDVETAMMAVQSNRVHILEGELKAQVLVVQAKNEQVNRLNQARDALNSVLGKFGSSAKPEETVGDQAALKPVSSKNPIWGGIELTYPYAEANVAIRAADVNPFNKAPNNAGYIEHITPETKKSDIASAIDAIKSQIDSLTNSQQMDMLRLQSLSSKRNEAFETQTNLSKKFQDPRNSIVGNFR